MAENSSTIRELVTRMVGEVLESNLRALEGEVVDQVVRLIEPILERSQADERSRAKTSERLRNAIGTIEEKVQQGDILNALLDGATEFCGRVALLVLRGNSAIGWQGRGFQDNGIVKNLVLDLKAGAAHECVSFQRHVSATIETFDRRFLAMVEMPVRDEILLLPLVIREKVAAILYADGGASERAATDVAALEILIRAAGQWVELQALRKGIGGTNVAHSAHPPVVTVSQHSNTARRNETEQETPSQSEPAGQERHENRDLALREARAFGAPVNFELSKLSRSESGETERKAKRFAKLLVDEIILYNRGKVAEGRLQADLYHRLKDDIDKSRESYNRRYANFGLGDYFTQAVIAGLAENNPRLMGSGFAS